MKISIIAAMDDKRGIGKDNRLPWYIPEDLQRFKKLTTGLPIIMGRKTFESIGRVLPNRTNIVITRDKSFDPHNHHKISNCKICDGLELNQFIIVHLLEEAIEKANEIRKLGQDGKTKEIFIIGGGQIFQQALPLADKLYLTIVEGNYICDTFFPDYSDFKKVVFEQKGESSGYKYKFLELRR